jgi:hypothetical protein
MSDDGNRFKINGEYLIAHNMNKNGKEFSILSNVIFKSTSLGNQFG